MAEVEAAIQRALSCKSPFARLGLPEQQCASLKGLFESL